MRMGKIAFVMMAALSLDLAAVSSSYAATPGVLGFDFQSARELADRRDIPLVVAWGNPGCSFCSKLRSAMSGNDVTAWLAKRQYVVVFADGDDAARSFVNISGEFPLCRVVWKHKTGNNYQISMKFHGRFDKMPSMEGTTLARQFMNSVDSIVGDYADVHRIEVAASTALGGTVSGGGYVQLGERVTLVAKPKTGYVLAGWYAASGERVSQDLSFDVWGADEDQFFTARFIRKGDDWVNVVCDLSGRWETGVSQVDIPVLVDSGTRVTSLSATKLPSGLSVDQVHSSIVGTPKKSGIYTVTIKAKTTSGKTGTCAAEMVVAAPTERYIQAVCDPAKGRVSGTGVYAKGKKAKLSVKASSGWVFSGWKLGGKIVSQSANYIVTDGGDAVYEAVFISTSDDFDSIALQLDGQKLETAQVLSLETYCGVKAEMSVVPMALTASSVSASGLPSGLKLTQDKTSGDYMISGVPSKVGGPYQAKLKVKTAAKNVRTYVVGMTVKPLPQWAYGEFSGSYTDGDGMKGIVTLKITDKGVISGKVQATVGTAKSYSVKGFDKAAEDGRSFAFRASGKNGLEMLFEVGEDGVTGELTETLGDLCRFTLSQNVWKRKDLLAGLPAFGTGKKQAVLMLENGLTLKFAAKGIVKVSGKIDKTSVSGTAQMELLSLEGEGAGVVLRGKVPLCLLAKSKFAGFCEEIFVVLTDSDGDGVLDRAE